MLPHLSRVLVQEVSPEGGVLRIVARTPRSVPASCPDCGAPSVRRHSGYQRRLADGVVGGRQMSIELTVRRLFCDAPECVRVTFAEQVEGLTVRYGRRTLQLRGLLSAISVALAGRAGERLAARLPVPVSQTSLLGLVMALPDPPAGTPRVLSAGARSGARPEVVASMEVMYGFDPGGLLRRLADYRRWKALSRHTSDSVRAAGRTPTAPAQVRGQLARDRRNLSGAAATSGVQGRLSDTPSHAAAPRTRTIRGAPWAMRVRRRPGLRAACGCRPRRSRGPRAPRRCARRAAAHP
ncbi:transposase family protein [Streptomyces sp. NPDC001530]|uniref:transposase family protein n=1 Tax=Streptomyces sp. NPDC001530 TaxID=3364582 RepID=UPI0036978423